MNFQDENIKDERFFLQNSGHEIKADSPANRVHQRLCFPDKRRREWRYFSIILQMTMIIAR